MIYEEMRLKKTGMVVRVYDITEGLATIFNPDLYQKQNNGWDKVNVSKLVPMDFPVNCNDYTSKTKKNKAKSRLELVDATWKTSDGLLFDHSVLNCAIDHELEIMDSEKNNEVKNESL